jgi:hypothetical protein
MFSWWSSETRVSPNKKDVTCKSIGPKQHETYATHFLFESQIRFCHTITSYILIWNNLNLCVVTFSMKPLCLLTLIMLLANFILFSICCYPSWDKNSTTCF